jgi:hypothetical protein
MLREFACHLGEAPRVAGDQVVSEMHKERFIAYGGTGAQYCVAEA